MSNTTIIIYTISIGFLSFLIYFYRNRWRNISRAEILRNKEAAFNEMEYIRLQKRYEDLCNSVTEIDPDEEKFTKIILRSLLKDQEWLGKPMDAGSVAVATAKLIVKNLNTKQNDAEEKV